MSASLDPSQARQHTTEQLIKGAEFAAAGKKLGLSDEQLLAHVSRETRRQKRADQSIDESTVLRQILQAGNSLTDGLESPEVSGVGYEDYPEVDPFGQSQDDLQKYTANDRGYMEDPDTGLVVQEPYQGNAEAVAPKSALSDALSALESERVKQSTLGGRIARVFGGNLDVDPRIARVEGGLEDYIDETGQAQKAESAIGAETVRRDSARFNPEVREANDWRAQAEASVLGKNYVLGGPGAAADAAIARIGNINRLGQIKAKAPFAVSRESKADFPTAIRTEQGYIDPRTEQLITIDEPVGTAGPNTPDTAQTVNAPARQWVADNLPDYSQGGRTFGNYPQTDLTGATTLLADRLRGLGQKSPEVYPGLAGVSSNVRSIDELDNAVNYVIQKGGERNKYQKMEKLADGSVKSVPTKEPGVQEVLNFLRYTPQESQDLASALYQLDSARRSSINQNPESQYRTRTGPYGSTERVYFDSPEAVNANEGYAPVAKITRGVKTKSGQQVSQLFRGLADSEAQKPFIGAVEGELAKRVRKYNPQMDASKIREVRRARGQDSTPEDQNRTRSLMKESIITKQRAERDAEKRAEKELTIRNAMEKGLSRRPRLGGRF